MYERTIAAATAETVSKFRLAEALALDIPRGTEAAELPERLAAVRQAISEAGGEPRAVGTLKDYRATAMWVQTPFDGFRWVPHTSFSVHNEARNNRDSGVGLTYAEFSELTATERTIDSIRRRLGRAGTDGKPSSIIRNWDAEQKATVLAELLVDPITAALAMNDPDSRQAALKAVNDHHERDALTRPRLTQPEDKPTVLDDLVDLMGSFVAVREELGKVATTLQDSRALPRSAEFRETVKGHVRATRAALDLIEGIVDGSSTDDLWAAFERSGGAA